MIALLLAVVCLVAMAWFNTLIGLIFLGFMAAGYLYFQLTARNAPKRQRTLCSKVSKATGTALSRRCRLHARAL